MIRIALYEKEPKTLKVKAEYDELTIGKIKKIPGRKYHKNEGKIWTIPYKYLNRLIDMFEESEIIYESGVNKNYTENNNYDFENEIKLLKEKSFKTFVRYIISETSEILNEKNTHLIATTKIAHALSQSRELTENEHDILIVASIIRNIDTNLLDELFKDNYDNLDIETKYIYNMYWTNILNCIKSKKSKLYKILYDASNLANKDYINVR